MTLDEAIQAYLDKFGEFPPILWMGEEDSIAKIEAALKSGEPMRDPDVPPGALI